MYNMTSGFNNKENLTIQPRARTCKSRPSPLWWGGGGHLACGDGPIHSVTPPTTLALLFSRIALF